MEINKYRDIFGGITLEDIYAGRMVVLSDDGTDDDGIYGVELPTTSSKAGNASFCIDFVPTELEGPYYDSRPSYDWALRQGWDQDGNDPYTPEVSHVYPGDRENAEIPSGTLVRIYGDGAVITVTSGHFIYDSAMSKGGKLEVAYSGDNKGKLQGHDSGTAVARIEELDTDNMELTFRILS